MKHLSFVTVLLTLLLSACAPATPTVDPANIQASAVAAANTMVALTQAAIPTETPIPPTPPPSPTPLPSPTLLALPTLSIQTPATLPPATGGNGGGGTGGNPGGDPCQAPLDANPAGPKITVVVVNSTKASVILSLYLAKTTFGECGYRAFNLSGGQTASASLPIGCYNAGAFVTDPKKAPYRAFGYGCFKGDAKGTVKVGTTNVIQISQ